MLSRCIFSKHVVACAACFTCARHPLGRPLHPLLQLLGDAPFCQCMSRILHHDIFCASMSLNNKVYCKHLLQFYAVLACQTTPQDGHRPSLAACYLRHADLIDRTLEEPQTPQTFFSSQSIMERGEDRPIPSWLPRAAPRWPCRPPLARALRPP